MPLRRLTVTPLALLRAGCSLFTVYCLLFAVFPTAAQSTPPLEPVPCPMPVPAQYTVNCGYLTVPADHAQPSGPTLQIAFAVVKSPNPNPAPDPVVYLHGGPGAHMLAMLPSMVAAFKPFLATRDVIFFDQRGVGFSRPALECPEFAGRGDPAPEEMRALVVQAASACRARLEAAGVDLTVFTSAQSVRDLTRLRQALGYPAWNMYGISYGTRLGLTVLRDDPASVRAMVLDAVYPPAVSTAEAAPNVQYGFEQLFAGCATDFVCHTAYPDLANVFYATAERLRAAQQRAAPITYTGRNPLTGASETLLITEYIFVQAVFNGLYTTTGVERLPALIYDVHEGRYAELANRAWVFERLATGGFSMGQSISIQCSEEFPFITRAEMQAAYATAPVAIQNFVRNRLGLSEYFLDMCAVWSTAPPNPVENQPVTSNVPTLILAGEYDPATPPAAGRLAGATLANSYFYELPAVGHGALQGGACPAALALAFFHTPTQAPAADCIAQMPQRPEFVLRAAVSVWPMFIFAAFLSLTVLGAGVQALRQRPQGWMGWRLVRVVGWGPVAVSLGLVLAGWWLPMPANLALLQRENLLATVLPLLAGLHAALLFSPEDEPALELALALPRPLSWVVGERWAWLLALHVGLALALSGIAALWLGQDFWTLCVRWAAPMLVLVALALRLTLSTRQAVLSLGLTLLLWFAFVFLGDLLVVKWPFLWPIHLYLAPTHPEFWLNRLGLITLGLALWPHAIAPALADTERLLFGHRRTLSLSKGGQPKATPSEPVITSEATPSAIRHSPFAISHPLFAVAYTELRLHWRRKALLIIFLATAAVPLIGAFMVRQDMAGTASQMVEAGGVPPEVLARQVTVNVSTITWAVMYIVMLLILPPVVADTFPRDAQWGVAELLHSLPTPRVQFILGKLLGLWASLLLGFLGLGAVIIGAWWLLVHPLDLTLFLPMFLLGGVGLGLLQAGLSAVCALTQPTRRRAIAVGLGVSLLSLIGLALGFSRDLWAMPWLQALSPGRPGLFLYFLFGTFNATPGNLPVTTLNDVYLTLLVGGVQLLLLIAIFGAVASEK